MAAMNVTTTIEALFTDDVEQRSFEDCVRIACEHVDAAVGRMDGTEHPALDEIVCAQMCILAALVKLKGSPAGSYDEVPR